MNILPYFVKPQTGLKIICVYMTKISYRCHRKFAPLPVGVGGEFPRIFAPLLGNLPPSQFRFKIKTCQEHCLLNLIFYKKILKYISWPVQTRVQRTSLVFLAGDGAHEGQSHSLCEELHWTHFRWNNSPQSSHPIISSYSSGSLHLQKVSTVALLWCICWTIGRRACGKRVSSPFSKHDRRWLLVFFWSKRTSCTSWFPIANS